MQVGLIVGCVVAGVALVFAILQIVSHAKYHRSLMASVCEVFLRTVKIKRSDDWVRRDISNLAIRNKKKVEKIKRKTRAEVVDFEGMDILIFGKQQGNAAIVYLHGAGYVRPPRLRHLMFAERLAKKSNLPVFFVLYPKAPTTNCKQAYPLMTNFVQGVQQKFEHVVLAGDSSGGGFAVGLCLHLKDMGKKQPEQLILFSPWVDVALENPELEHYQKLDPFISVSNEKIWGKLWAGDLDVCDPKVSPSFGNLEGLPPTTLYVGTREILYPDNILFFEKLRKARVLCSLHVGEGMNHVYPIYPIPEARKVLKEVVQTIQTKNNP